MNAKGFIPLLGLTADDPKVKKFLGDCGITKQPKLKRDSQYAYVSNAKLGIEITFEDERFRKSDDYEEGALVLNNVTMYGGDSEGFSRFAGELPLGLKFDFGLKEAKKILKKPSFESSHFPSVRWDFKSHSVFIHFDKSYGTTRSVSLMLPSE